MIASVDLRHCPACDAMKPVGDFYKMSGGGIQSWCKACTLRYSQEHRAANRERYREYVRDWHRNNRFKVALSKSRARKAKAHGYKPCSATEDEIRSAFTGHCDICGKKEGKRKLHMDHDHGTGNFRGWICSSCNKAIGHLFDSHETALNAAEYLEFHNQKHLAKR